MVGSGGLQHRRIGESDIVLIDFADSLTNKTRDGHTNHPGLSILGAKPYIKGVGFADYGDKRLVE